MPATYEVEVDGKKLKAEVNEIGPNTYRVRVGGSEFVVRITSAGVVSVAPAASQQTISVVKPEKTTETTTPTAAPSQMKEFTKPAGIKGKEVKIEVPGRVLKVLVNEGQEVKAEDTIITIESMKMELEIKAGIPGKVIKILVKPGDSVNTGDTVAIIQPEV